ncbi:MAG TPA: thiolase family protein [Polyangia bacterium]|jgi:acetyl-CoA acetyltransferase family protein|nr:thiolase family protein [Polyangia bacterium]
MSDAVIVAAVRSAIGKKKGALANTRADDLLALILQSLAARVKVDPKEIDDVIAGCVTQVGEQGFNIARTAALMAGYPIEVTGTTVNRQCGSSQQAFHFAAQAVMSGMMDAVVACGVESMTRIPMGSDSGMGLPNVAPAIPFSPLFNEKHTFVMQHDSAELIAAKWGISRRECEELALESHQRAAKAREQGRFRDEIAPLEVKAADGSVHVFDQDEGIRPDTTLEKLAGLKTVTKPDGVVTAGTASQISDGAAALLVTSSEKAKQLGLKPRARVKTMTVAGVDPTMMLHGVIPATQKALARANLKQSDIGLVEINEAFASVVLAWSKELDWKLDNVNVNGGAVALGHPLGASGARLMTTLLNEMEKRDVKYGLQTMCIGFGQATCTILERL